MSVSAIHPVSTDQIADNYGCEYSGEVEHPDRLILNTLTGEIEQAFRRN